MSYHIRNCLSQTVNERQEDIKFHPFSQERNQLGKIIHKNCFKKVISSEEILETLKIPSEQYFLIKKIEKSEQRYFNWKKENMKSSHEDWNDEAEQKSLQRLKENFKRERSK